MNKTFTIFTGLCLSAVILLTFNYGRSIWHPYYLKVSGKRAVQTVMDKYGGQALERLNPYMRKAGFQTLPKRLTLIAYKNSKVLELWGQASNGSNSIIKTYNITAASGIAGPKLREGDRQVPEGIYSIAGLNPNSSYHLSMKINYPNEFDLTHAKREGREEPGTNIFIHGKSVSIGCIAVGDIAIEELFTLVKMVGRFHVKVIISPSDPRLAPLSAPASSAEWVRELYNQIEAEIKNSTT